MSRSEREPMKSADCQQMFMRMPVLYLLIVGLLMLGACTKNSAEHSTNLAFVEGRSEITYSDYTISTKCPSPTINSVGDKTYMVFLGGESSIVVNDMEKMTCDRVINLSLGDSPDQLQHKPSRAYMLDANHYVVESLYDYYVVDSTGKVKQVIDIYDLLRKGLQKAGLSEIAIEKMGIWSRNGVMNHPVKGEIFLNIVRPFIPGMTGYPDFPQFAKLSIDSDFNADLEILPLYFPAEFSIEKGKSYKNDENPGYSCSGDWLVYNYPFSSLVFFYNTKTGEQKQLAANTSHGSNHMAAVENTNRGGLKKSTSFSEALYDEQRGMLYVSPVINVRDEAGKVTDNTSQYLIAYDMVSEEKTEIHVGKRSERRLHNNFLYRHSVYMTPYYPFSDEKLDLVEFTLMKE